MGNAFSEFLSQISSQYGLVVLVLVLVLLLVFGCFLLWKLVWRVWNAAMEAKDKEIERVSKERDKYQTLVFERLRSSEAMHPTLSNLSQGSKRS